MSGARVEKVWLVHHDGQWRPLQADDPEPVRARADAALICDRAPAGHDPATGEALEHVLVLWQTPDRTPLAGRFTIPASDAAERAVGTYVEERLYRALELLGRRRGAALPGDDELRTATLRLAQQIAPPE